MILNENILNNTKWLDLAYKIIIKFHPEDTEPSERCFILPNGKYINCPDSQGMYNTKSQPHYMIENQLFGFQYRWKNKSNDEQEILQIYGLNNIDEANILYNGIEEYRKLYNSTKSGSLILEIGYNCIRVNGDIERYIVLPPMTVTTSQLLSLEEWINKYSFYQNKYTFEISNHNENQRVSYDLSQINASYITNRIKRFYNSGNLLESQLNKKLRFTLVEELTTATPYMIRNDGAVYKCKSYHPYICNIYDDENDLTSLVDERLDELLWFYNNSNNAQVKEYTKIIVKYLCSMNKNIFHTTDELYKLFNIDDSVYLCSDDKEVFSFLYALNNDVNQEFCRVRTSDIKYGGESNDIYFRISSIGFNWFNIIWKFVCNNYNFISTVTVAKDGRVRDYKLNDCYKINGIELNHIPTDDFLLLKGNPIIEHFNGSLVAINDANELLLQGKTIEEAYPNLHPRYMNGFYNRHKKEQLDWDVENILSIEENLIKKFKMEIPKYLYHATYKPFLKSILDKGLGNTHRKMWSDSKGKGIVYLATDAEEAISYAEEAEWLDDVEDEDKYLNHIIVLKIDTDKLDKNKLFSDENVIDGDSTYEYHGIINKDVIVDIKNQTEIETTLTESTQWYHDKDKFSKHITSLINSQIQSINKKLDKYGFEVMYIDDYEFEPDDGWIAVFCNEIQDNASEFPMSINTEYLYKQCLNDDYMFYDLRYHIEKSIWHEIGHGIQNYLYPDYDYTDIEQCAEEFAEYMMDETNDCELMNDLTDFEENP